MRTLNFLAALVLAPLAVLQAATDRPNILIIAGACAAPAIFGTQEVAKSGASDLYAAKWKLKAG